MDRNNVWIRCYRLEYVIRNTEYGRGKGKRILNIDRLNYLKYIVLQLPIDEDTCLSSISPIISPNYSTKQRISLISLISTYQSISSISITYMEAILSKRLLPLVLDNIVEYNHLGRRIDLGGVHEK